MRTVPCQMPSPTSSTPWVGGSLPTVRVPGLEANFTSMKAAFRCTPSGTVTATAP